MVFWWRFGGVSVVIWWCFGGVTVFFGALSAICMCRECF